MFNISYSETPNPGPANSVQWNVRTNKFPDFCKKLHTITCVFQMSDQKFPRCFGQKNGIKMVRGLNFWSFTVIFLGLNPSIASKSTSCDITMITWSKFFLHFARAYLGFRYSSRIDFREEAAIYPSEGKGMGRAVNRNILPLFPKYCILFRHSRDFTYKVPALSSIFRTWSEYSLVRSCKVRSSVFHCMWAWTHRACSFVTGTQETKSRYPIFSLRLVCILAVI